MFSENNKISGRQLKRLIVMDSLGKAGLLLPRFTEKADGRSFMISLLICSILALIYVKIIGRISDHVEEDFYDYIRERLGVGAAWFTSIIYICYSFLTTVYLVRLFAAIAVKFLLPESSQIPLMVMVLLAGAYIAIGGLEAGARVSEIMYTIVLYPLAFMLLCAVFSANPDYLAPSDAEFSLPMVKHGLQMFIIFGGMGMVLFITPHINKRKVAGQAIRRGVLITCISVFLIFLVSIGTFGEAGMWALPWPVITLMSSARIPGGFLQRWDIIFTVLLLGSFFVSVGIGLYYMRALTEKVLSKSSPVIMLVFVILVLAAALWCGSYENAVRTYTIIGGYILVPVAVLYTIFLAVVEYIVRRRRR